MMTFMDAKAHLSAKLRGLKAFYGSGAGFTSVSNGLTLSKIKPILDKSEFASMFSILNLQS